ncbi:MAG: class I tRNA ligase family protein, partial [Chloroflexota bacterium]
MSDYIFIGIAWPYANGRLHLGRVVGALLPADIFARYHRLQGNHVLAVTGSDAHGTPITIAADKAGVSPKTYFEGIHQQFLSSQLDLGISYDLFTHTDTENHHRVAQDLFCKLYEKGFIAPKTQNLFYSESEQRFLPDRYVEGTCPHCGFGKARGDQCDECGHLLDPTELIKPRSTRDGSTPTVRESEQLFFDLGAFSEQLLTYLDSHAHHWRTNPLNFTRGLIEQGLKQRPFTRDLDWGISAPIPGWEHKKLYIWAENIIGYLSAAIEWSHLQG